MYTVQYIGRFSLWQIFWNIFFTPQSSFETFSKDIQKFCWFFSTLSPTAESIAKTIWVCHIPKSNNPSIYRLLDYPKACFEENKSQLLMDTKKSNSNLNNSMKICQKSKLLLGTSNSMGGSCLMKKPEEISWHCLFNPWPHGRKKPPTPWWRV